MKIIACNMRVFGSPIRWSSFRRLLQFSIVRTFTTGATSGATPTATGSKLYRELKDRNLIHSVTSPNLWHLLESKSTGIYCGVDPTAKSLHVGNLLPLITALRLRAAGHRIYFLVGGATGRIGDPSGRSSERTLLTPDVLATNLQAIQAQLQALGDRLDSPGSLTLVNNAEWFQSTSFLDFLVDVGKHVRVSTMLARDSVKQRLQSDQGISFTEFSYQLIQAYDFFHLHQKHQCQVQLGGSDQWGNMVAGLDLIQRKSSSHASAFGLALPLVTTSTGEKFGKSAGNAVWIDPQLTSPFDFYQFFIGTSDTDVETYLLYFSFRPVSEMKKLMEMHQQAPEKRLAQKALAWDLSVLVHGEQIAKQAELQSSILFPTDPTLKDLMQWNPKEIVQAFDRDPRFHRLRRTALLSWADVFVRVGACKSKSEAVKLAKRGGLYLNHVRQEDRILDPIDPAFKYLPGSIALLRTGKTNYWIVQFMD